MTDTNYLALVLIIDRSGSMAPIANEMESGLRSLVAEQAEHDGRFTVDVVFFDHNYDERYLMLPVKKDDALDLLDLEIRAYGMTALYDAVGRKISSFGRILSSIEEDKRPDKVLFVIATDGEENCSAEYHRAQISEMIEKQRRDYNWEFTFLGANQDAVAVANELNIEEQSALTFRAEKEGVTNALSALSNYTRAYRTGKKAAYTSEDRAAADDSKP